VSQTRTFVAAPPPAAARRAVAAAVGLAAAVGVWLWWTAAGSGIGGVLIVLAALTASPFVWQLGMVPHAYSVEARTVRVHRRWLPDSRFPIAGPAERYDPSIAAADPESVTDRINADTLLMGPRRELTGRRERMFKAVTNIEQAVRVSVPRGALLVSPDDPEAFVRATGEDAA
jgi:hypothetical protein